MELDLAVLTQDVDQLVLLNLISVRGMADNKLTDRSTWDDGKLSYWNSL